MAIYLTRFIYSISMLFLYVIIFPRHTTAATFSYNNLTDYLALMDFKSKITSDPYDFTRSWNTSLPFCAWSGVTCGRRHRRVIGIDLQFQDLVGFLSPFLGNLSFIRVLDLRNNKFQGKIPAEYGNLFRLQSLYLDVNSLQGEIPKELGSLLKLKYLSISNNKLTGGIPHFHGNLTSLLELSASGNQLDGSLHPSLGLVLPHLWSLDLSDNALTGPLPLSLSNASKLERIDISNNNLTGKIAINFAGLKNLKSIYVQNNMLGSGEPDEMNFFSSLTNYSNLFELDFSMNQLRGELPNEIGNLSSMIYALSFAYNYIYGSIPSTIGKLNGLHTLDLQSNRLTGTVPTSVGNLQRLRWLSFSLNHLSGSLPLEMGGLVKLTLFDVSVNNLSGKIPESIRKCVSLVKLNLEYNSFSGPIPSFIRSLNDLIYINLSHNSLSGKIPFLYSLQTLDLSFNNLEGEVPMLGIFASLTRVLLDGNRALCGGVTERHLPKCKPEKHIIISNKIIIPSITIGVMLFVIGLIWLSYLFICSFKRRRGLSLALPSTRSHLKVSYGDLFKATNGFSLENLTGVGSFGSVYIGIFDDDDGVIIAVKVFNLLRQGASKSFIYECEALREVRHRNLVKIISCCSSIDFQGNDFKALVYEFMPNGSLEDWLHPNLDEEGELNFLERINVVIDVAYALEYLHHHCERQIVHCDIKPSNILLDNKMTAHVGDFGLAKLLPFHTIVNESSNSIGVRGTIGYVPPEYGLGFEVSAKGDVYSYGILLLEIMTGKRPTDAMFVEGLNLHKYVSIALQEYVIDIVDPTFHLLEIKAGSKMEECLISIYQVGLACSADLPRDRMDMKDVVLKLVSIRNNFIQNPVEV